jgi:hypothetical protein
MNRRLVLQAGATAAFATLLLIAAMRNPQPPNARAS